MVVGLIGHHGQRAAKHVGKAKNIEEESATLRNQLMVVLYAKEAILK